MSNSTLNLILASNRPMLFKELLEKGDIDYKELLHYLLQNSSTKVAKDAAIVQFVYNSIKFTIKEKLSLFKKASKDGWSELVKLLLLKLENERGFTEAVNNNLLLAVRNGHTDVVRLLLANPRVDPSSDDNWVIGQASYHGHIEIVRLLLADPRVDPSAENNYSIRMASVDGHTKVVKLLLADPRVDPSDEYNFSIRSASENGHIKVVKLLLADSRVDPSAYTNNAIQNSSYRGHKEVVKLLLADSRVNPSALDNWAIQMASEKGHIEVVKLLLADKSKRVDPSDGNNYSIRFASDNGHGEIVRLLSLHPKLAYSNQLNVEILAVVVKAWLDH